jgi:putative toxin-antitoxin system antitoxin component (TIGR02293 family)
MSTIEATVHDSLQAERQILAGIEWSEAEHLASWLDVPMKRLAQILQIPPATMQRRKESGRFSVEESERVVRIARLWFLANQTVGGPAGARSWLTRGQFGLGGRMPLDVARLEVGARSIETLLHRIRYNVLT